ncbi:MAG: hypothetical protein RLZ25_212 [Pseudomonadota bacterium]
MRRIGETKAVPKKLRQFKMRDNESAVMLKACFSGEEIVFTLIGKTDYKQTGAPIP